MQKIEVITRRMIIDELIALGCVPGHLKVSEFISRVFPKASEGTSDINYIGAFNDIWRHMDDFNDWEYEYLFYSYLDFNNIDDYDFIYFLEQYVHPGIRRFDYDKEECKRIDKDNSVYVEAINRYLKDAGFQLKKVSELGGKPVYKAESLTPGVEGKIKNIIFASQYKPEITLGDALNNDIKIISNEDKCLVYDQPITSVLTWEALCNWYKEAYPFNPSLGLDLPTFMKKSLDSPPEKLFFDTYLRIAQRYPNVPALLPQVWLYYDPKLEKERIRKIYEHQRMDFLMIFSDSQRVVVEIDGAQHYSDDKGYASTDKYAEMMAAEREMSLAGYDVYRFGGKELYDESIGRNKIRVFFFDLFKKYGLAYSF